LFILHSVSLLFVSIMNSFKESVRNWFGYSRRERRSTFILLNMIIIVMGIRFFFPFRGDSLKEFTVEFPEKNIDNVELNLQSKLAGKQIMPKTNGKKRLLLDLNKCDSASLVALPGIGPVLSARILKYRSLIGGYVSVLQLKEVYGLPEETFNLISSRVSADSLSIRKIMINEYDFKQLIRHPYFQKSDVISILKYRELKGRISGIEVMIENNLISPLTAKKIGPYLEFGE